MQTTTQEIILMNGMCTGFSGRLGLRRSSVFCRAKDGRTVHFAKAKDLKQNLDACLVQFETNLSGAHDFQDAARAAAIFWMGFIALHPFENGNGRTGKKFLELKLAERGISVKSFDLLDRYLIEGSVQRDLDQLTKVFLASLQFPSKYPLNAFPISNPKETL